MSEKFNRAVRSLCGAIRHGDEGELTDADLLEAFLLRRDERAFDALVRRHGSTVLGVCRRIAGDTHDAEDAFQTTFLVLVQSAGAVRSRGTLGAWLYGVACRTNLKMRARTQSRRTRERVAANVPERGSEPMTPTDDWPAVLVEEIGALPEKYRAPVVLC